MQRYNSVSRGGSRPPSAPPTNGVKRKERDFEQETGDETNINVVVRCRGRSEREVRENSGVVVSTEGVKGKNVELYMGPNSVNKKTYNFDKVFSPAADQAIIFEDVVLPILSEMLNGFNCTIFAYGQTGTGKTYTMSGDMTETYGLLSDAAGIIPRVLQKLFQSLEADAVECSVKCSFIELYNEELRDLLATDDAVKLKIFDDANKKSHSATLVQGMEESHIKNAAAGIALLQKGSHRRQVAATKCNDLSSRSHTVFTITTFVKKCGESGEDYICSGKLNLVDLAGSENIGRSGAENKRATEAGLINKSLLTLGRVINALVDKSAHIPYRESKLTRLLQDSLGGRTKTCIIATVSPARSNLEETISTLDYAFRAKNIRNKPQINSMISKKTLLREFTTEIEKLKTELIATRQRNGVYLTNDQFEEMTMESESRKILSEEQKARIETMEVSLRNKVQELHSLTSNFAMLKKDNDTTHATLNSTKDVLEQTELVLRNTQSTLAEESSLRQRYAETESKLHEVGQGLLSTIGMSLKDIDGLHAKLKRRSILHGQNKDAWQEIQSYSNEVLGAVDARLHELKQQHEVQMRETSTRIEAYMADELERAQQTISLVSTSSQKLERSVRDAGGRSSKARDEMNEVLEEIKVLRDDVKTKVGEGLNDLSDAAARISGEVIAELDQFHTQLHTSYAGLGKDFKNLFEDLTRQLANQREESDRLRKALQEANRKNIENSIATASHLEANLEIERKAAEEEKADIMQQVAMLLTSSMSRRDERLNRMTAASQAKIVEATEEFELADKAYADGMDRWAEQDTNLRETMSRSKEELKTRLKNDWTAVDARNSAIQDSTKAVHQETVKIVEAQVQAMDTQMAALDGFVIGAREQNNVHHQKNAESLEAMSQTLTAELAIMKVRLQENEVEQFSSDMKQRLEDGLTLFQNADASIYQPLSDLKTEISQDLLVNYAPTGETPARKQWDVPRTLPRTIPIPEEPSTTPVSKPPGRTPGQSASPRKFASPKKSPKKQLVHVDTPPRLRPTTTPAAEARRPITSSGLRDLDINLVPTTSGPPLVRSASDTTSAGTTLPVTNDKTGNVTITTTTTKLPTKSSSSKSSTDKENLTVPLSGKAGSRKAARTDVDDKENLTMPLTGVSEKLGREKFSQSVFGGGTGAGPGGRLTRSRTKGSPDFGRSVGV